MTEKSWRLLPMETNDAATNMAIDEAISDAVATGNAPPTIRCYRWKPSAVSIGYFQSLEDEVDLEACRGENIDYVRRRTGGGAVYHDYDGEVTYSIIGPLEAFPEDIRESYRVICGDVIDALAELGIEAAFEPINDIVVDGKKISGNAQTRRKGVLLQHGTVLHAVDPTAMFTYLRPDVEKVSDKLIERVEDRVTSIVDQRGPTPIETSANALMEALSDGRSVERGTLTAPETEQTQALLEKYRGHAWNHQR